jgi:hypothetical protein
MRFDLPAIQARSFRNPNYGETRKLTDRAGKETLRYTW